MRTEEDHRFFGAAGAQAFHKIERIELPRFVAHEHRIEHFVAKSREAGGDADRLR